MNGVFTRSRQAYQSIGPRPLGGRGTDVSVLLPTTARDAWGTVLRIDVGLSITSGAPIA